jgi:hypothetical protein
MATVNPRIGGGTDKDAWLTGGSNVTTQKSKRANTLKARRPSDYKSADRVSMRDVTICHSVTVSQMYMVLSCF